MVLAAVALAASASAIFHVLTSTDAARVKAVQTALAPSLDALADAFIATHAQTLSAADRPVLEDSSRTIVAALADTSVGFCMTDGGIVAHAMTGRRGEPNRNPKPLPPDQRDALVSACMGQDLRDLRYLQLSHPHDVIVIGVRRIARDGSAWVLTRIPTPPADTESRWKVDLGILSAATLLLVAVTLSAVFALGGGVRGLEGSLRTLQQDLRAPLGRRSRASSTSRVPNSTQR